MRSASTNQPAITPVRVFDITITVDPRHFKELHTLATQGAPRLVTRIFSAKVGDRINVRVNQLSSEYDVLGLHSAVEDGVDAYVRIDAHGLERTLGRSELYRLLVEAMEVALYATGYNSYLVTVGDVAAILPRNAIRRAQRLEERLTKPSH